MFWINFHEHTVKCWHSKTGTQCFYFRWFSLLATARCYFFVFQKFPYRWEYRCSKGQSLPKKEKGPEICVFATKLNLCVSTGVGSFCLVRALVLAKLVTVLTPTGSEISGFRKEWVFRKRSAHFAETCRKSHFFERFLNKVIFDRTKLLKLGHFLSKNSDFWHVSAKSCFRLTPPHWLVPKEKGGR